jgi:enoyl-CoA hydratase
MDLKYLNLKITENVALVEISRPPVNALNTELVTELAELFKELDSDPESAVVILTGKGKAFVAGADISEMQNMNPEEAEKFSSRGQGAMNAVAQFSKPVIASINGFALGGGCELALACDIRYAIKSAKLGQPEVKLGVIPGFGGTQRLPRTAGAGISRELIYSGGMLEAEDAQKFGLVDRVFDSTEELMNESSRLAEEIAKNSLNAVISAKKLINDGLDLPLNAGLELERRAFSELFGTGDQLEGMKAFLEKRPAKFQNK